MKKQLFTVGMPLLLAGLILSYTYSGAPDTGLPEQSGQVEVDELVAVVQRIRTHHPMIDLTLIVDGESMTLASSQASTFISERRVSRSLQKVAVEQLGICGLHLSLPVVRWLDFVQRSVDRVLQVSVGKMSVATQRYNWFDDA